MSTDPHFLGRDGPSTGRTSAFIDSARSPRTTSGRPAPGTSSLVTLLQEAGPSLILIDEPLEHTSSRPEASLSRIAPSGQTPLAFLQELGIAVANCPHAVLVTTLTSQIL